MLEASVTRTSEQFTTFVDLRKAELAKECEGRV